MPNTMVEPAQTNGDNQATAATKRSSRKMKSEPIHLALEAETMGIMPWLSYRVNFPVRPLPSVAERPHTETKRLVVRPFVKDDLEQFHKMRSIAEVQNHSPDRGRPSRDLEESREQLEQLQTPNEGNHWYFGAFLLSTGELIGEGGMPDVEDMPRSGWPDAEILIKPEYWRQGYGTELLNAILTSWWDLPRSRRRHQLLPVMTGFKDPGENIAEGVGFVWEETNKAAYAFFTKVLGQAPVAVDGHFTDWDRRDGRQGNLVRWGGALVANPNEDGSSGKSTCSSTNAFPI